jgi:hypothetical protein
VQQCTVVTLSLQTDGAQCLFDLPVAGDAGRFAAPVPEDRIGSRRFGDPSQLRKAGASPDDEFRPCGVKGGDQLLQ